jgi:hypothetical protein
MHVVSREVGTSVSFSGDTTSFVPSETLLPRTALTEVVSPLKETLVGTPRHRNLLCRHKFDHDDLNMLPEAAEHGDVQVLEHAVCCGVSFTSMVLDRAVDNGHWQCVDLMARHMRPLSNLWGVSGHCVERLVRHGRFDVLSMLVHQELISKAGVMRIIELACDTVAISHS